jgi:hypothetical protein
MAGSRAAKFVSEDISGKSPWEVTWVDAAVRREELGRHE